MYDKILIGTSPANIVEAIYCKKNGDKVLILDRSNKIGGAWTTIKHKSLPELEIGCHIWSVHKPTSDFISRFFEINLKPLSPQPQLLTRGKKIPYDWKMNVISIKRILNNLKTGQIKNFKSDLKNPAYRLSIFPSKYFYPERGATELKQALERKINEYNLDVILDSHITEVHVTSNKVQLISKTGKEFETKKLSLTSLSEIKKFTFDKAETIVPKFRKINYIHLHLIIRNVNGKQFSYLRWMDDNIIHRVSDITSQIKGSKFSEDHKKVFIVGIKEEAYNNYNKDKLVEIIKTKLEKSGYINNESIIESSFTNLYPSTYNDKNILQQLVKKSQNKITILPSTDLIFSFSPRIKGGRIYFLETTNKMYFQLFGIAKENILSK
jgi:hypothetical protein